MEEADAHLTECENKFGAIVGGGRVGGESERSETPQEDEAGRGLPRALFDFSFARMQDRYEFLCRKHRKHRKRKQAHC